MADPKLTSYIQTGLANGQSIDAIRNQLIQQGWSVADVDSAVLESRPKETEATEEKKRPTTITFFAVLGGLLSVGLIFFGLYSMVLGFVSESSASSLLNNLSSFVPFLFLLVTPRMVRFQVLISGAYLLFLGAVSIVANIQLFLLKRLGFWLFLVSQIFVLGGSIVSGNFFSIHGVFVPLALGIYVIASKELFT